MKKLKLNGGSGGNILTREGSKGEILQLLGVNINSKTKITKNMNNSDLKLVLKNKV